MAAVTAMNSNLAALKAWREDVESRTPIEMWSVRADGIVTVAYAYEGEEALALHRACFGDRHPYTWRPSTRKGVVRFDFVPPFEYLAADEDTMRTVARVLARNRIHGLLRRSGDREGERF